jgi:hypothetical protein
MYRFDLSSFRPAPICISGPALERTGNLCDKCSASHVSSCILWVSVMSSGSLLFGTAEQHVYTAGGHGCAWRLVVKLNWMGVSDVFVILCLFQSRVICIMQAYTSPVLLHDDSAFLFRFARVAAATFIPQQQCCAALLTLLRCSTGEAIWAVSLSLPPNNTGLSSAASVLAAAAPEPPSQQCQALLRIAACVQLRREIVGERRLCARRESPRRP